MELNKKQKLVLCLGAIAFIVVGAVTETTETWGGSHGRRLVAVTDYGPLIAGLLSVVVVTAVLVIIFKTPKKS